MKFNIQKSQSDRHFSLIYREAEFSFDSEPHDGSGFASIMINDLQLEIDDKGCIIYVWGLCPLIKYEETSKVPRDYSSNSLVAVLDKPPIPGISYCLNEKNRWPLYINKGQGWVCIGDPNIQDKPMVEFVPHCIAVLDDEEIVTLWLKPQTMPQLR